MIATYVCTVPELMKGTHAVHKMKFTRKQKSDIFLHLKGLALQYVSVSGEHANSDLHDGPFGDLMRKFESAQLVVEFTDDELRKLLRHLDGASKYDKVVHKSNQLGPLIKKIKRALDPVQPNPRTQHLIECARRRTGISTYQYHKRPFKAEFSDAVITDTKLSVEVPDSGDVMIMTATSTDNGRTYVGRYEYRGRTYNSGNIEFTRERKRNGGDTFKGQWIDPDERDRWILEVDPPEE